MKRIYDQSLTKTLTFCYFKLTAYKLEAISLMQSQIFNKSSKRIPELPLNVAPEGQTAVANQISIGTPPKTAHKFRQSPHVGH